MNWKISLKKLGNNWILILVLALLMIRLFLNSILPMMDNTEARYAEIARLMAETNDWITPQIDYGVPFWAKTPLSTWLSAAHFKVFGVNEFSARLPYFVFSLILILLVGKYSIRQKTHFLLPGLILSTLPQFFLHAGVVSTDTALAFSVTVVMLSFWEVVHGNKNQVWKYLFFVGMGLGLLAKGPIVGVLTVPPLVVWTWRYRVFHRVKVLFPWSIGSIITVFVAAPWYILAEITSPGFLDYFFVGEHFNRFFVSGWSGDKYGTPKSQPYGMVWIFLLLLTLPWIIMLLNRLIKHRKMILKDRWLSFLVFWFLWTPLFFTVSKNLIHPYILPVMVPAALLITLWWQEMRMKKLFLFFGLSIPLLMAITVIYGVFTKNLEYHATTDKYLISQVPSDVPLFHLGQKSYSSQFYSHGKIRTIDHVELESKIESDLYFEIIIKNRNIKNLSPTIKNRLLTVKKNRHKTLFRLASLEGVD